MIFFGKQYLRVIALYNPFLQSISGKKWHLISNAPSPEDTSFGKV